MKRVVFVIDPLHQLKLAKDTSLYLMQEALLRDYEVFTTTVTDLFMQDDRVYANLVAISDVEAQVKQEKNVAAQLMCLSDVDVIVMRKDPPFNMRYIYATYFLEQVKKAGVIVLNDPQSIRDCNEKFFITHFPQCIAETMITEKSQLLFDFLCDHNDIVLKALDSMGGDSVFRVQHDLFADKEDALVFFQEKLDRYGFMMAQRFLPEVYQGDKRIILIDGEPLPYAVVRLPKENEFRANLAQGGHYQITALTERDYYLCQQLESELKMRGLFFVGLDVIGDYISEINVTSPTCMRELATVGDLNPARHFWHKFEQLMEAGRFKFAK